MLRVETDHNGVTDNNGRCGAAVVLADQLKNRLLVHADVFYFEMNSSRREEGLGRIARWSTGLAEHYDFFLLHEYSSHFRYNIPLCKIRFDSQVKASLFYLFFYAFKSVSAGAVIQNDLSGDLRRALEHG